MINEIVLVGKIKELKDDINNKEHLLLEVERAISEENERKYDIFDCQLWKGIFHKVLNSCTIGDLLAIKGRMINDENKGVLVIAERVVILNKTKNNI